MAPPACIECALTSFGMNPTCGPVMVTAARRALVVSVLQIEVNFPLSHTPVKGVLPMAPWCQRYSTRRLMAATARALGCPMVPWPMDSPLTPFF